MRTTHKRGDPPPNNALSSSSTPHPAAASLLRSTDKEKKKCMHKRRAAPFGTEQLKEEGSAAGALSGSDTEAKSEVGVDKRKKMPPSVSSPINNEPTLQFTNGAHVNTCCTFQHSRKASKFA